jgi:ParB family chromosome partitioning protein
MQSAIVGKEISEGHARTLLALNDRPEERETLFKEIVLKKISVRAAERIARSIAQERVRKHHRKTPEMMEIEKTLTETLGTRVIIETNAEGGRLLIDFFSPEDLSTIAAALAAHQAGEPEADTVNTSPVTLPNTTQLDDPIAPAAPDAEDDELYSVTNFVV